MKWAWPQEGHHLTKKMVPRQTKHRPISGMTHTAGGCFMRFKPTKAKQHVTGGRRCLQEDKEQKRRMARTAVTWEERLGPGRGRRHTGLCSALTLSGEHTVYG